MWKKIVEYIQNLLVPEETAIQKLLNVPADKMRELLPKSPIYSKDIFVLFDYQNKIVRALVKSIKYKNNSRLRKRLASYLYDEIVEIASDINLFEGAPPILVPMPMSKLEKRKRGFNQCEELVREIKKLAGKNLEVSYNILKKVRETERQTALNREKRMGNVKNSMFASLPSNTPNDTQLPIKTVIVLDDVYTTGATLAEARRAFSQIGIYHVIGLFIAH